MFALDVILPLLLGVDFSVRYLRRNEGDMQHRGDTVRQRTVCDIAITMVFHEH